MSLKLEYNFKIISKELLFEKHYHGLDRTEMFVEYWKKYSK